MKMKDAKLLCLFKYGRLPRTGYEMKIIENEIFIGSEKIQVTVWVVHECNTYRVKTFYHPCLIDPLSIQAKFLAYRI